MSPSARRQWEGIGWAAAVGVLGGLLFRWVFPAGALTTLMHEVLGMPGPGAGIAVLVGPVALLLASAAREWTGAGCGAAACTLAFGAAHAVASALGPASARGNKGGFGTLWFVAALLVCGLAAEGLVVLARKLRPLWRLLLAGCGANGVLLAFYWSVVFPRTAAGWVAAGDVPVLLGAALGAGALGGLGGAAIAAAASAGRSRTAAKEGG
jgi:hypothetical protein